MDIIGRTKPKGVGKGESLLSQSCICLLAALLLSCWERSQDYAVILKSVSLVAYKNERERTVQVNQRLKYCVNL